MYPLIESHRAAPALAARYGIENVRVFGSIAWGDADEGAEMKLPAWLLPGKNGPALERLAEGGASS